MTVKSKNAYRQGLWAVKIWPLILFILVAAISLYLVFDGLISYTSTLYILGIAAVIMYIWSLVAIVRWKKWMVLEAENPKTALEMARSSFLSSKIVEKMAVMGSTSREQFEIAFNDRMTQITQDKLSSASHKFEKNENIKVHQNLHGVTRFLIFEFVVCAGVVILFIQQEDLTIRLISGALFILGLMGIFYTFRSLFRKQKSVLEVTDRGIRIDKKYYGWGELEVVDIVRGDTLIFQPNGQVEQERKVDQLSMPADYLDELILFHKTAFLQEKDNPTS